MSTYRHLVRPFLFRQDPEQIHESTLKWAHRAGRSRVARFMIRRAYRVRSNPRLAVHIAGLDFPHPLGLAAGFDKNGRVVEAMAAIGFGHVEVGSVSAEASEGNPRPRLFRLPEDEAIVVNYGVPNDGAHAVADRLAQTPIDVPLGVNIVETNTGRPTVEEDVVDEFVRAARPLCGVADYLTLNLNCPNTTAGVSPFDDMERLTHLLHEYSQLENLPPVWLKFTAHRDTSRAEALMSCVAPFPFVAGFIFNLPPGKEYPLRTAASVVAPMPGTLCGAPTRSMMDETLRFWYGRLDRSRFKLVGSGGIADPEDAYRKIRLGASMLQLYTGLVYEGPGLVGRIIDGLDQLLRRDGFVHISEAVGVDVPA
ncbi:MAG: quinone-dependent dihydroorotate dehydrogenase [Candidatus Latescibacterota bacterium]|nr:quinone-dependent dihydroorotate dehydrogenase [Candidatus Latescibacterota bacterium]